MSLPHTQYLSEPRHVEIEDFIMIPFFPTRRLGSWPSLCTLLLVLLVSSLALSDDKSSATSKEASGTTPAFITPLTVGSKTGQSWDGNRGKIEFLWCEPGSFVMGSPKDELNRVDDEDQVPVTLTKGFWLGKFEVTQEQWRTVMNSEPWAGRTDFRSDPDAPVCYLNWDQAHL